MEWVYFIQDGRNKAIKIGRSIDPLGRLSSLKTANPNELRIVGLIPTLDAAQTEKELHKKFARGRWSGEWFAPDEDLVLYLQENVLEYPLDQSRLTWLLSLSLQTYYFNLGREAASREYQINLCDSSETIKSVIKTHLRHQPLWIYDLYREEISDCEKEMLHLAQKNP